MSNAPRPQPGPAREYHFPKFESRFLTNGMRIIISPVPKLPVITVLAVIDATAIADPEDKEGVAEITAQALRDGTVEIDGTSLTLALEKLGTSLEAGADWDSTVVSLTVLRDKIDRAFTLFSEVIMAPPFGQRTSIAFGRRDLLNECRFWTSHEDWQTNLFRDSFTRRTLATQNR